MTEHTPPALIRDLMDVGVHVVDIWDLVNTKAKYPSAIPVLIEWLRMVDARVQLPDRKRIREALIRALSVPEARPTAAPILIEEFVKSQDASEFGLGWAAGNALSVVADDSMFDAIATLAQNPAYGKARQMIVLGLGKSRDPRAVPLLVSLLGDEDVVSHAVGALGMLKSPEVRRDLEGLQKHPRALVRREVKKALARLGP